MEVQLLSNILGTKDSIAVCDVADSYDLVTKETSLGHKMSILCCRCNKCRWRQIHEKVFKVDAGHFTFCAESICVILYNYTFRCVVNNKFNGVNKTWKSSINTKWSHVKQVKFEEKMCCWYMLFLKKWPFVASFCCTCLQIMIDVDMKKRFWQNGSIAKPHVRSYIENIFQ